MTKTQFFVIGLVVSLIAVLIAVLIGMGVSTSSETFTVDNGQRVTQTDVRYSASVCGIPGIVPSAAYYHNYWTNRVSDPDSNPSIATWIDFSGGDCISLSAGFQIVRYGN